MSYLEPANYLRLPNLAIKPQKCQNYLDLDANGQDCKSKFSIANIVNWSFDWVLYLVERNVKDIQ